MPNHHTADVYRAWIACEPAGRGSLHTDGNTIYSYATPILTRSDGGRVVLNMSHYSSTTSRSQYLLEDFLATDGIDYQVVHNVPQGSSIRTLLTLSTYALTANETEAYDNL